MAEELRTNKVYKALHKPLTYLGVERGVFAFVCIAAIVMFNILNSLLAGLTVFLGGILLGRWLTKTDAAFLRILGSAGRTKARYDAAKQHVPNVEVL